MNQFEVDGLWSSDQRVTITHVADRLEPASQWCGPCKMIKPLFEQMSAEYESIYFLQVDVDDVPVSSRRQGRTCRWLWQGGTAPHLQRRGSKAQSQAIPFWLPLLALGPTCPRWTLVCLCLGYG